MSYMKQTLEWCAQNEVCIEITQEGGSLNVKATNGRVYSQYPISEPINPGMVGNALWAAIYSVQEGTKFHAQNGMFPDMKRQVIE